MNLDSVCMFVTATADRGVVGLNTRLHFRQKGSRVVAHYSGGAVTRGCLAGSVAGATLVFRYVQREASGELHAGRSFCDILRTDDGRLRVIERFRWTTREGEGTNVFDEVID
jgi:hypothetical protein